MPENNLRRKHSIIDGLPDDLKNAVEEMLKSNCTYAEVADFIRENGYPISVTSIHRYASRLNETVQNLRFAQENLRVIMEETAKYPGLDTADGIIRLLSHQMLMTIQNAPEDYWQGMKPEDLLGKATGVIRAAAYKQNIELKNKDVLNAGFEQVKIMLFESIEKERPDLYADVVKYLESKGEQV